MDRIWTVEPDLSALDLLHENTAVANLGITMEAVGADFLAGKMPVDHRTLQPYGLVHGGANALLLETLASAAANHCLDQSKRMAVGLEINCNHVRSVKQGHVYGRATAVHIGRRSMVWDLQAVDDQNRPVCIGRLTAAVIPRPGPKVAT